MNNNFWISGPLDNNAMGFYIERDADREIVNALRQMSYVTIIEPSQQGKTSLVNRLILQLKNDLYFYSYIYFDQSDQQLEDTIWYNKLGERILKQIFDYAPECKVIKPPTDLIKLREFLSKLGRVFKSINKRIIIILDEIGVISPDISNRFFSVLRNIYNSRNSEPEFLSISFIFLGRFRPEKLISDKTASPFNIANNIELSDFTELQVMELVRKGGWSESIVSVITPHIFKWTGGHPFLTQLICSKLSDKPDNNAVDDAANWIIAHNNNLRSICSAIEIDILKMEYLKKINDGEKIKYLPSINTIVNDLELLGVIKERNGFCIIRNAIYEKALGLCQDIYHYNSQFSYSETHLKSDSSIVLSVIRKLGKASFSLISVETALPFDKLLKALDELKDFGLIVEIKNKKSVENFYSLTSKGN